MDHMRLEISTVVKLRDLEFIFHPSEEVFANHSMFRDAPLEFNISYAKRFGFRWAQNINATSASPLLAFVG